MEDELAEQMFLQVLEQEPGNGPALSALESLRRRLGKFEELVEMLLERSENADNRNDRARAYAEIGRLYSKELDDQEQALVAFTQAFCEDARNDAYPREVERIAGSAEGLWEEVLSTCMQATQDEELPAESRNIIYLTMANWYLYKRETARALELMERVVEGEYWAAFGYIAAEADLARLGSLD